MKIITLNTWVGRAGRDPFFAFLEKYRRDTDVFCFQEIRSAPHEHSQGVLAGGVAVNENIMAEGVQEISERLSDFVAFFHPQLLENYGLMMLVKKELLVKEHGDVFVHKHRGYIPEGDIGKHARNIQYATLDISGKPFTIINFHGLWNGMGKTDTDDRIEQSKNILNFTRGLKGDFVLCGDFNLLPDTESIRLLEQSGLRNLIKEYGVTSTRTSFYTKPEKFADYVFVTPSVKVADFAVLPEEVSDHAALMVEVEV
ncbi:endonuclease/exonuclease/phosphatase family protein [Candidatus Uhrbacteria bacterium]|nr:MAG: endonuclease/exonuclease/phosphatase family protein [Candidatus Uhrbacteria bacterium]